MGHRYILQRVQFRSISNIQVCFSSKHICLGQTHVSPRNNKQVKPNATNSKGCDQVIDSSDSGRLVREGLLLESNISGQLLLNLTFFCQRMFHEFIVTYYRFRNSFVMYSNRFYFCILIGNWFFLTQFKAFLFFFYLQERFCAFKNFVV